MKNSYHINRLCSQLYESLRRIQQTRAHLDEDSAKIIVQALILSQNDYCNSLLAGPAKYQLDKLQRIQNMACRIAIKVKGNSTMSLIISQGSPTGWKYVKKIAYKTSMPVFKCKCNLASKYLQDLLPNWQHTRSLRSSVSCVYGSKFMQKHIGKKNSSSLVGPRKWNSLPDPLKA